MSQDGANMGQVGPSWDHLGTILGESRKINEKNAPQATKIGETLNQISDAKRILAAEIIGFVKKTTFFIPGRFACRFSSHRGSFFHMLEASWGLGCGGSRPIQPG